MRKKKPKTNFNSHFHIIVRSIVLSVCQNNRKRTPLWTPIIILIRLTNIIEISMRSIWIWKMFESLSYFSVVIVKWSISNSSKYYDFREISPSYFRHFITVFPTTRYQCIIRKLYVGKSEKFLRGEPNPAVCAVIEQLYSAKTCLCAK